MYVMSPTVPSPGSAMPSYRRWAMVIVLRAPNPSLRAASCWRVEVVKGGAGERLRSLRSTFATR